MILSLNDIHKTFPGPVTALNGVSLDIRSGENLSIVGESGCGKTTLARVIMGLVAPDEGTVVFNGRPLLTAQARRGDFCRQVRMVFQDPFSSLDPRYSVRAILKEALALEPNMTPGEEFVLMRKVLDLVRMPGDILTRYPHEFSGGERQRIAIARALMTSPRLLILDEAVSSLDVLVQQEILLMLEELQRRMPVTYLFISHNLRVVKRLSRKVAVMHLGRIVEYGDRDTVLNSPSNLYTQALLKAAFNYEVSL
jgi:peptide/nickel transport system ATP-binding protein/oligopeptide transport system ATP-binding protein